MTNYRALVKEQQDKLKMALADGLHSWSLVELALSHLFVSQVNLKKQLVTYTIWDSIFSFEGKFKCLDDVLSVTITDEELSRIWKKLADKIRAAQKQRNQIAHFGFVTNSKQIELVPYLSMAKMSKPKELKRYNPADIEKFSADFYEIQRAIEWFATVSAPLSQPDSKDVLPAPTLMIEIRKTFGRNHPKGQGRAR